MQLMSIIKNYGLFWQRNGVEWGRQKVKGTLKGLLAKGKRDGEVDFWEQHGIYALYADYRLVYIGQTKDLGVRLRAHTKDRLAGRWDTFSWFGLRFVKNDNELSVPPKGVGDEIEDILNILEAISCAIAEPPLNLQSGRFGDDVEYYLQYRGQDEEESE